MKFLAGVFASPSRYERRRSSAGSASVVPEAGRHRAPAGPARRLDGDARRLSGRHPDVPRVVEGRTISSTVNGTARHERRREDVNDPRGRTGSPRGAARRPEAGTAR